jgi:hypothetical protein
MRYKKMKLSVAFFLSLGLSGLQAQESLNTTGMNASGSGGSVNYSIGQMVYIVSTGPNGSVAEGIQQPFEISIVTAIEETKGINLSVMAYPNPTNDYLTLSIDEFDFTNLSYQLYDIQEKLLQTEKITGKQTNIAMVNLVPAIYFIKVIQENRELKIFKIIKN